jgi:ribosomal protein S18 acetylase RimI-like enzyme
MDIAVRMAITSDAEQLSKLNQEFNGGNRRPLSDIVECLNKSTELVSVAVDNGNIVGFACAQSFDSFCYEEPQGEITELYVEEASRKRGVATSLISCLELNLQRYGVKRIKVLTGKENNAAIKTYEHCDYIMDDDLLLKKKLF